MRIRNVVLIATLVMAGFVQAGPQIWPPSPSAECLEAVPEVVVVYRATRSEPAPCPNSSSGYLQACVADVPDGLRARAFESLTAALKWLNASDWSPGRRAVRISKENLVGIYRVGKPIAVAFRKEQKSRPVRVEAETWEETEWSLEGE